LHTWATDTVDETVDPRFGKVGKQRIADTGPLTRKRMETVDEEFIRAGFKFMDKARAEGNPFFVWFATSRMHVFTTLSAAAGVPDIRERIAAGDKLGTDVEHRNYIDGLSNLDYWTGKSVHSARDDHAAEDVAVQRGHGSPRKTHGDPAEVPAEAEGQQPEPRELRQREHRLASAS